MTIAYKMFDQDWKCRGFQYDVGKKYKHEGKLEICKSGFHACLNLEDCFDFYDSVTWNKIAKVKVGNFISDGNKIVTDEIEILEEITWENVI